MPSLFIAAGHEPVRITPQNGKAFTLAELKAYLNDGYLELPLILPDGSHFFCDEDGKRKQLPYNRAATLIFRTYSRIPDVIVGNVVIVGREHQEKEDVDDEPEEA